MKQLIYIPTKVEDELPEDGTIQFELCGKNKSVGWYQNGVRQHVGATEWLKPTEANVFTDEQLLELKKKWMSEAWDASKDYTFDAWDASANMHPTTKPDKQSFLNSIKLDIRYPIPGVSGLSRQIGPNQ
jgi:hypothetical protein